MPKPHRPDIEPIPDVPDNIARSKPPVEIDLLPSSHQPSKAEQEEEIDMPGWSLGRVRDTFMRPFTVKEAD